MEKIALAKYVLHGREHLVLLRATVDGLILHTAYFSDEIRDPGEIERGAPVTIRDGEMALARKLIEELATHEFHPEKYSDEYRARLLELVEAKVEGAEVTAPPPEARRAQVIDLMEALKRSLAQRTEGAVRARRPGRAKQSVSSAKRRTVRK